MFCKNCGKKLNEGLKFCGNCGEDITKEEIAEKVKANEIPQQDKPETATIKCGNCVYVGPGEPARRMVFTILAWLCVLFAPLITIIYFVATHKYRCPKCKSTFLGIKNKQGVFAGQRGGASRVVWIVVFLVGGIAIIGILSSIVLASLNAARIKSRDARRIADIKQIQLAVELYYDANGNTYPSDISSLAPNFIPSIPSDPLGGFYAYHKCSSNSYHLGASLEEASNPNLSKDKDIESMCFGDTVNGLDSGKCSPSDAGLYCYDVSEGSSVDTSIDSSSQTYYYYTNSLANVRTCPSFSCDAVVQYEQNTKFDLPYSPNDMPEWVKIEWQSDQGNTGVGYMNKSVFSLNPTY